MLLYKETNSMSAKLDKKSENIDFLVKFAMF